jgi:hypothetical protein
MTIFSTNFSVSRARQRLLAIVERVGADHKAVNPSPGESSCTYAVVKGGVLTPVCIVGTFVADLGLLALLLDGDVDQYGDTTPSQWGACTIGSQLWDNLASVGVTFDTDAQTYLRLAQEGQDFGLPWSKAVEYADARYIADATVKAHGTLGTAAFVTMPYPEDFAEDTESPLTEWEKELLNG